MRRQELWKRRSVEKFKSKLFHLAWKSRQRRGIPTFPQLRRLRLINPKPDISLAKKTGHFNLLRTAHKSFFLSRDFDNVPFRRH
jgi:hypothetical protein